MSLIHMWSSTSQLPEKFGKLVQKETVTHSFQAVIVSICEINIHITRSGTVVVMRASS